MKQVIVNDNHFTVANDSSYLELVSKFQNEYDSPIVLVEENNKIRELFRPVKDGASIRFITLKDRAGHESYKRSATFLMLRAVYDLFGVNAVAGIRVHFSIKNGYYCTSSNLSINSEIISKVIQHMRELAAQSLPIQKYSIPVEDAIEHFTACGMLEKARLFRLRRSSNVNVYRIGEFEDYFYGYMLPDTSLITCFDLYLYDEGFVLSLPSAQDPYSADTPAEPAAENKIFNSLKVATEWSKTLDVAAVGALNDQIVRGNITNIILAQEALMEKEIGNIAAAIAAQPTKKLIMIAGPSSSGKTTFSHRLSVQLMAHGLKPHPIACDNYFVEREATPLDEKGAPNYECLGAMDIALFNEQMSRLLSGENVSMPTFNFMTGHKEYKGDSLQLGPEDVLVIEGIHCLNDAFSYSLPKENKYKIYLSALTQLNIDEHNRVSTSDGRMLRRMVRDARTRGYSASHTISMWPSVRRGEDNNIFPYQDDADSVFNSSLIYEISILKQYAEPLLLGIASNTPEWQEAQRLLKFLSYFQGIDSNLVPQNSLIREFIGGSIFNT